MAPGKDRLERLEERLDAMERGFSRRLDRIEVKLGLDKIDVDVAGKLMDDQEQRELRLERIEARVGEKDLYSNVTAGKGKASRVAARATVRPAAVTVPQPVAQPGRMPVRRGEITKPAAGIEIAEQWRGLPEGAVTVMGSSMVRGIGQHLQDQAHFCDKICYPGARIEDIAKKVEAIGDRPESHMVFMVGTNNLIKDQQETMLEKYGTLIEKIKERNYRKVSVVGILERNDFWMRTDRREFIDCKRIGVNLDLAEMCVENGIEFVDVEIEAQSMLDRKGLHLNEMGQDFVAGRIFKHCRKYLN